MDFNEYQDLAGKTAIYPKIGSYGLLYPVLGLAGEAGEVCEKVKKLFRDRGGVISEEFLASIKNELGDVLWYLAAICRELNLSLDDIAKENLEKLLSRQNRDALRGDGDFR